MLSTVQAVFYLGQLQVWYAPFTKCGCKYRLASSPLYASSNCILEMPTSLLPTSPPWEVRSRLLRHIISEASCEWVQKILKSVGIPGSYQCFSIYLHTILYHITLHYNVLNCWSCYHCLSRFLIWDLRWGSTTWDLVWKSIRKMTKLSQYYQESDHCPEWNVFSTGLRLSTPPN